MHKRTAKIWNAIGLVGRVLVYGVAAITILSWLRSCIGTPEKALTADVSYGLVRRSPSSQRFLDRVSRLDNDSLLMHNLALREILKKQLTSTDSVELKWTEKEILWKVEDFLQNNGLGSRIKYEQSSPDGYWRVQIRNAGSKVLRNVRISLPYTQEAWLEFRGVTDSVNCAANTISIAEMQPKEQAFVFAFTKYYVPGEFGRVNVQLTHDEGIGKVHVLVPCGSLGQWVESPPLSGFFFVLLLVAGTLYFVLSLFYIWGQKPPAESQQSPSSTEKPPDAGSKG